MSDKKFLDDVYNLKTAEDTRQLYDDWSTSYDAEVAAEGYATPRRIALALQQFTADQNAPVLDFGCGTGMSGAALKSTGFSTIDGCDLSQEMLLCAAEKQVYRRLWQVDAGTDQTAGSHEYAAIVACGVISKGAAPPETMNGLIARLAPGGLLVFSFNDHTFEDPRFEAVVNGYLKNKTCQQLFRQNGEHLPGIGLQSTVFVLERL